MFLGIEILSGCRSLTEQQASDNDVDEKGQTVEALTRQPCVRQTHIVEIVTDLYAIGSKIRNPNTKSRLLDSTLYQEIDPSTSVEIHSRYSEYDKQHVSELLLELRQGREDRDGTYDYIIDRLAAALTLRRKQFRCWKNYSKEPALKAANGRPRLEISSVGTPVYQNGDGNKSATPDPVSMPNGQSSLNKAAVESVGDDMPLPAPPAEAAQGKDFTCPYLSLIHI